MCDTISETDGVAGPPNINRLVHWQLFNLKMYIIYYIKHLAFWFHMTMKSDEREFVLLKFVFVRRTVWFRWKRVSPRRSSHKFICATAVRATVFSLRVHTTVRQISIKSLSNKKKKQTNLLVEWSTIFFFFFF